MLNDIPPSTEDTHSAEIGTRTANAFFEAETAPLTRRVDIGQKIGELTEIKCTTQILKHLAGILRTIIDSEHDIHLEMLDHGTQKIAGVRRDATKITDLPEDSAGERYETRVTVGSTTLVVSSIKLSAQCEHDVCALIRVASLQIEMNARRLWKLDQSEQPAISVPPDSDSNGGRNLYQRKIEFDIERLAASPFNGLITGETGTGKTRSAKQIHTRSARAAMPFVAFNSAAIPEHLAESELFGYKKGAFTGAIADRPGLFEAAIGGTLFIDEVGDLSLPLQSKLLTAIEERKIRRLGENSDRDCDVRIIAGTSCNLPEMIRAGKFRADLYYRLATLNMHTLPLRERSNEIPGLIDLFLVEATAAKEAMMGVRPEFKIESRGVELLCSFEWTGNIRELRNTIFELTSYVVNDQPITSEAVRSHLTILKNRHVVCNTRATPAAAKQEACADESGIKLDAFVLNGGAMTLASTRKLLAALGIEVADNDIIVPLDACIVRSGETLGEWEARTVVSCIDATREKLGKWQNVAARLGIVDSAIRQRRRYAANKLTRGLKTCSGSTSG